MPTLKKSVALKPVQPTDKLMDELFHLERTISNSDRMNADVGTVLQELRDSVDNLNDTLTTFNETVTDIHALLTKMEKRNANS